MTGIARRTYKNLLSLWRRLLFLQVYDKLYNKRGTLKEGPYKKELVISADGAVEREV